MCSVCVCEGERERQRCGALYFCKARKEEAVSTCFGGGRQHKEMEGSIAQPGLKVGKLSNQQSMEWMLIVLASGWPSGFPGRRNQMSYLWPNSLEFLYPVRPNLTAWVPPCIPGECFHVADLPTPSKLGSFVSFPYKVFMFAFPLFLFFFFLRTHS